MANQVMRITLKAYEEPFINTKIPENSSNRELIRD